MSPFDSTLRAGIPDAVWQRWIEVELVPGAASTLRPDDPREAGPVLLRALGSASPTAGCLLVGGYGTGKSVALASLERDLGQVPLVSMRAHGQTWSSVLARAERAAASGATMLLDGLDELQDPPNLTELGALFDRVAPQRAVVTLRDTLERSLFPGGHDMDVTWRHDAHPVLQIGKRGVNLYSLTLLSEPRVRAYLRRRFRDRRAADPDALLDTLERVYDLRDLVRRFVLLDAICAIVEAGDGPGVDRLQRRDQIYERAIGGLCRRESLRDGRLSSEELRDWLERVAMGGQLDRASPELLTALAATGLVHEGRLTHASFEEYLRACVWVRRARNENWRDLPAPNPNDLGFLAEIPETREWLEGLVGAVPVPLAPTVIELASRTGAQLQRVAFTESEVLPRDLRGLRLVRSDCGKLDFSGVELGPADLTDSRLADATWTASRAWRGTPAPSLIGAPAPHQLLVRAYDDTVLIDLRDDRVAWGCRVPRHAASWFDGCTFFMFLPGEVNGNCWTAPGWEPQEVRRPTRTSHDGVRSRGGRGVYWQDPHGVIRCDLLGRTENLLPAPRPGRALPPASRAWDEVGAEFGAYDSGRFAVWTAHGNALISLQDLDGPPVVGSASIWYRRGRRWRVHTIEGEDRGLDLPVGTMVISLPTFGFAAIRPAEIDFCAHDGTVLSRHPEPSGGIGRSPEAIAATGHVVDGVPVVAVLRSGHAWLHLVSPHGGSEPSWLHARLDGAEFPTKTTPWMGIGETSRSRIPGTPAIPLGPQLPPTKITHQTVNVYGAVTAQNVAIGTGDSRLSVNPAAEAGTPAQDLLTGRDAKETAADLPGHAFPDIELERLRVALLVAERAPGAEGELFWRRLAGLLGLDAKTEPAGLRGVVEEALMRQEAQLDAILRLLRENPATAHLVGAIHAQKVVVAHKIDKVEM